MSNNKSNNNKSPQKRIEYRGENVRVSRTGGVAVTKTFKGDGHAVTLNTNHGVRLHKRLFKGARMGFQNGNFQFIGRYHSKIDIDRMYREVERAANEFMKKYRSIYNLAPKSGFLMFLVFWEFLI